MDESTKTSSCKECKEGEGEGEGQLQAEVDHLRQHLAERDAHIVALEGEFLRSTAKVTDLEEQVSTWREKYERLYDSHKRVQKLNQVLEDKLLQMVDKMKGEKGQLTKDIATLSVRLAESKHNVGLLQKENERYKNDMNLAIQLLQCKPDNFVSHKLDNLPVDTQTRVSQYVMSKTKPTTPTQSKNGNDIETFDTNEYEFNISASLMSKILEDSIHDTITKHCDTCTCSKSQNKPFSYDETHYSVSTQTALSGEMKNSLCLNCNIEVKSAHSNISIRSASPHAIKVINDKNINQAVTSPVYIVPQKSVEKSNKNPENNKNSTFDIVANNKLKKKSLEEVIMQNQSHIEIVSKINEEFKRLQRKITMEPGVHHKLCERKKNSISSNRGSDISAINEDLLTKESASTKDSKQKIDSVVENVSLRKNSQGSTGAMSRTSSIAKSTSSTHKSNTQVGPGPRFCSLRMQAGSKNILLDNAQPDVPPVLYKRQSKCSESAIFKELTDGLDNFIDMDKDVIDLEVKTDTVVVESTLIDVHVDNNNKDVIPSKPNSINPVLMNVSSSPLQPLKTHSFSNDSEKNNNSVQNHGSQKSNHCVDNLLNDFNIEGQDKTNFETNKFGICNKNEVVDDNEVKIFNFDRYEQSQLANQYMKSLRKFDMSQFNSIESTKIAKDQQPDLFKFPKKNNPTQKSSLPPIVNVYPNLTQTHLKVNENKKVFTNEQSTSSLSSDDSAALLQKQQLLRVAEWVEQNLEQQNNLNDPSSLDDELNFNNKAARRDSKLHRLTDTLEMALKMPHPVSKYSKTFTREEDNWLINNLNLHHKTDLLIKNIPNDKKTLENNVAKETVFPVEESNVTSEIKKDNENNIKGDNKDNENNIKGDGKECEMEKKLNEVLRHDGDKEITPEELARMEYNVKRFLLSGPQWGNTNATGRSRRTSSKTETDV